MFLKIGVLLQAAQLIIFYPKSKIYENFRTAIPRNKRNMLISILLSFLIKYFTSVLQSYNRISIETFRIQILFFKNLYHLNSKSKENFLNIELFCVFFKNKGDSLGWCS